MFGRINSKTYGDKRYSYYIPGILNDTEYYKIYDGRIFLKSTEGLDFNPAMKFCNSWKTSIVEKTDEDLHMRTGKQRIKFRAIERGITLNGI
jgi:hypothetical protein